MAIEYIPQFVGIYRAGENLSDKEGYAVRLNSFQRWQLATTGEDAHGLVAVPTAQSGQVARVCVYGIHNCISGGAFPAGRPLSVDVNGKLVESNGGAIVAYSVGSASAEDEFVEVFVGARGGVNVILDSLSDPIGPGETKLVDAVSTDLVRAATWLVTIEDDPLTGTEYFQVNANHVLGSASHQVFGWVKTGSVLSRDVVVEVNGIDNLMELKITNNGLNTLNVRALQIRTVST